MLDEPSLGLAPVIVDEVFERIGLIHQVSGAAILLVEQRAAEALEIASRGYVLDHGEVTLSGPTDRLLADDAVRAAYVGV
jgi:branched-chain amino acid transport system ATP-binding protein